MGRFDYVALVRLCHVVCAAWMEIGSGYEALRNWSFRPFVRKYFTLAFSPTLALSRGDDGLKSLTARLSC